MEIPPSINWNDPQQVKQYNKQYYLKNIAKREFYIRNFENPEDIKQVRKDWYIKNKERLLNRQGEMIMCDCCKIEVRRDSIIRHNKSKRHTNNLSIN